MNTKYSIGDTVLVPLKVSEISVKESGIYYLLQNNNKVALKRHEDEIVGKYSTEDYLYIKNNLDLLLECTTHLRNYNSKETEEIIRCVKAISDTIPKYTNFNRENKNGD